jgi:hypothetical protein
MTPLQQEEYRALRATIRERGTTRVWIFAAGIALWAGLAVATAAVSLPPVSTLVPLLVLASAFEAVFALHVGVERVGRYLQTHFDDGWEAAMMAFGRPSGAATIDALFAVPFLLAALFNLIPALLHAPTGAELIFIGGAHSLFVLRVVVSRYVASRQRAIDLERFQQIRKNA